MGRRMSRRQPHGAFTNGAGLFQLPGCAQDLGKIGQEVHIFRA